MATIAHVAAGMAGGRVLGGSSRASWKAMAVLSCLSLLADLDVIAFSLGIPYSAPFGHRGATHSLVFAAIAGSVAGYAVARIGVWPMPFAILIAVAVAVSHPLLDAMTDGGLGVALLWPFSNARFFAPWRPLPVAPIGARMLSARGMHVVLVELLWSFPVLAWSVWPRRRVTPPEPGGGAV